MQMSGQNQNSGNSHNGFNIGSKDLTELLQEVLDQGSIIQFTATGGSMSPFIRSGDTLKIAPLHGKRPVLGQVYVFRNPLNQKLLVHRLVAKKEGNWILRGDSYGRHMRDVVPSEALLGIVESIDRCGKPIQLGLGLERVPLAILSRYQILHPLIQFLRIVKNTVWKK